MKDKSVLPKEKQLNKFLQSKCLIPGGLGLWEIYFRKICAAWSEINGEIRPQHIIFSADNGCNMEGYVGYNYEVTQKQSRNSYSVVHRRHNFVTLTIFLMRL